MGALRAVALKTFSEGKTQSLPVAGAAAVSGGTDGISLSFSSPALTLH